MTGIKLIKKYAVILANRFDILGKYEQADQLDQILTKSNIFKYAYDIKYLEYKLNVYINES